MDHQVSTKPIMWFSHKKKVTYILDSLWVGKLNGKLIFDSTITSTQELIMRICFGKRHNESSLYRSEPVTLRTSSVGSNNHNTCQLF